MKDGRNIIARVLTTTVLVLAGIVVLVLYRQIKSVATGTVPEGQLMALQSMQSSGVIGAIEGPFVINGMNVEIVPSLDGERDLEALVEAMQTDGWEETVVEQAAELEKGMLSGYRILQRDDESRFLLAMDWLGGIAVLTVPLGQEIVSPVPAENGQWTDVPGDALPGVPQPMGSRQMLNVKFSGGGHICYQLPAGINDQQADETIQAMGVKMQAAQWQPQPLPREIGMLAFVRAMSSCLIWSPPPVEGTYYVAVLMTETEKGAIPR